MRQVSQLWVALPWRTELFDVCLDLPGRTHLADVYLVVPGRTKLLDVYLGLTCTWFCLGVQSCLTNCKVQAVASNDDRERSTPRYWANRSRNRSARRAKTTNGCNTRRNADRERSQFCGEIGSAVSLDVSAQICGDGGSAVPYEIRGEVASVAHSSRDFSIHGIRAAVGYTSGCESIPAEIDQRRRQVRSDAAVTSTPCQYEAHGVNRRR